MHPIAIIFLACTMVCAADERIKHVVVLMQENRPFDHIFGWAGTAGALRIHAAAHVAWAACDLCADWKLDGLAGNESNAVGPDPSSGRVRVSDDCPYINECDPDHGTPSTTYKVCALTGASPAPRRRTVLQYSIARLQQLFGGANASAPPSMSGFVEWEARRGNTADNYCDVMRGFAPGQAELPRMP
jgi:hypothetical protein